MTLPLMPKATAVWLIDNTALTFAQIAGFCGLHELEVEGIANGEVAANIIGQNPITNKQLTREEIDRCEKDSSASLVLTESAKQHIEAQQKKKTRGKYTPVARRQDKPDAIAWFLKHSPEVKDAQISKLIGTTKATINAVRGKTHWNSSNIRPKDPVLLGLCSQTDLDAVVTKAKEKAAKEAEKQAKLEEKQAKNS